MPGHFQTRSFPQLAGAFLSDQLKPAGLLILWGSVPLANRKHPAMSRTMEVLRKHHDVGEEERCDVSLSTSKSTHSKARAIVVLLFWDTVGARKCAAFCIESDKRQPHVPGKCWR
jgi:hypothetical protein